VSAGSVITVGIGDAVPWRARYRRPRRATTKPWSAWPPVGWSSAAPGSREPCPGAGRARPPSGFGPRHRGPAV